MSKQVEADFKVFQATGSLEVVLKNKDKVLLFKVEGSLYDTRLIGKKVIAFQHLKFVPKCRAVADDEDGYGYIVNVALDPSYELEAVQMFHDYILGIPTRSKTKPLIVSISERDVAHMVLGVKKNVVPVPAR
jgi:hypothetical protein